MFPLVRHNSDNTVSGVTGDVQIGDRNNHYYCEISGFRKKILASLSEKTSVSTFFSDLQKYLDGKTTHPTVGLEKKLKSSGFENIIDRAIETKEKFVKLLAKSQYSLCYQKIIYATIDEATSLFIYKIQPMIDNNDDKAKILKTLSDEIFNVLYSDIADISELTLDKSCLEGLIYYMTGNCYLKWAYNDTI